MSSDGYPGGPERLPGNTPSSLTRITLIFIVILLTGAGIAFNYYLLAYGHLEKVITGNPDNFDDLLRMLGETADNAHNQAIFWHHLNVSLQVASIILGVIATLMIALQDNDNAYWMKPIGIVAATLTTGIVAVYGAFHIRENVDILLKIEHELAVEETNLAKFIKTKANKLSDSEKIDKVHEISEKLNDLGERKRRIIGTIGLIQTQK